MFIEYYHPLNPLVQKCNYKYDLIQTLKFGFVYSSWWKLHKKIYVYVHTMVYTFVALGNTTQVLLTNIFKVYIECYNKHLVDYIWLKQENNDKGQLLDLALKQIKKLK